MNLPCDTPNIEYHIVTLFEKLDALRRDSASVPLGSVGLQKTPMQVEIRTLEFWRSIISECLSSFFYVFIVCGAVGGAGVNSALDVTALATGFAIMTLTQCFGHVSGNLYFISKFYSLVPCRKQVLFHLNLLNHYTSLNIVFFSW